MIFAICNNDSKKCEYFHDMLYDYMDDHKINSLIYSFVDPNTLLNEIEDGKQYDYLLLDENTTTLYSKNCWLEKLTEKTTLICLNSSPIRSDNENLFFIDTTHEVPLLEIDRILNNTLKRKMYTESLGSYFIQRSNKLYRLPVPDILYIEHEKSNNIIHMTNLTVYTERKTMNQTEQELNDRVFLRCHRAFAVNMMHVTQLTDEGFKMKNGDIVPVSKKEMSRIRERYLQFYYTDFERMDDITHKKLMAYSPRRRRSPKIAKNC